MASVKQWYKGQWIYKQEQQEVYKIPTLQLQFNRLNDTKTYLDNQNESQQEQPPTPPMDPWKF